MKIVQQLTDKLTSLLGDYGNNSDSELDDSFVDGGNRATTQEHDTSMYIYYFCYVTCNFCLPNSTILFC